MKRSEDVEAQRRLLQLKVDNFRRSRAHCHYLGFELGMQSAELELAQMGETNVTAASMGNERQAGGDR